MLTSDCIYFHHIEGRDGFYWLTTTLPCRFLGLNKFISGVPRVLLSMLRLEVEKDNKASGMKAQEGAGSVVLGYCQAATVGCHIHCCPLS